MKTYSHSRNLHILILIGLFLTFGCNSSDTPSVKMAIVGQSLIKVSPEKHLSDPFGSVRPIIESADVGFTNFEMAVDKNSDLPEDYQVMLGEPSFGSDRPGNTSGPHAVNENVMEFLSSMNFKLQSLSNNHAWDLGSSGIQATIEAAKKFGVTHAGTGNTLEEATRAAIIEVKGIKIALIAATTSRDERDLVLANESSPGLNGVWTGWDEDWDRNIAAVKTAGENADFVIYYHHFQFDQEDADGEGKYGHKRVGDMFKWQESFAKAVIDAGAGMYIAHGDRVFDGVEIYKGRPIFRQFGGFSYQGLQGQGAYDPLVWEGLLGMLTITDGYISTIQISPLALNEGNEKEDGDAVEFREKRGFSEVARGARAAKILNRFKDLSAKYGASVIIEGEKATIEIQDLPASKTK
ncbi:MAG: CapA family protein [bacterium]|nr:CapA family protein [bacterium]